MPIPKRDRPLQVLCLGISRSGTDSLRNVLLELGCFDVHHGYRFLDRSGEILQWLRLAHFKHTSQMQKITAREFDKCLGDCEAVTDSASAFAQELLTAYPDAKVVLNYRLDVDAWHASISNTITVMETNWLFAIICYFQRDIFWQRQAIFYLWQRWRGAKFNRDGKQWYRQHYDSLEKRLQSESRAYLKWKVEDGWKPLCEFLEKSVPATPFPNGNNAAVFQARVDRTNKARLIEAGRNMLIIVTIVVGVLAWANTRLAKMILG